MKKLLDLGFAKAGEWKLEGEELTCDLFSFKDTPKCLYAFISNGVVGR